MDAVELLSRVPHLWLSVSLCFVVVVAVVVVVVVALWFAGLSIILHVNRT
jgi:hypothetical protein